MVVDQKYLWMKLNHLSSAQTTLTFLLSIAFKELLSPRILVIEHSFSDGLFCHEANWRPISGREIESLFQLMKTWINSGGQIEYKTKTKSDVIDEFKEMNSLSKLEIAQRWNHDKIPVIEYGQHWDYQIGTIISDLSKLPVFELRKYNEGFLMRLPTPFHAENIEKFKDHPKLFSTIKEHEESSKILNIASIRELNDQIRNGNIQELINVAEELHDRKINDIAVALIENHPQKRLISIAGPSSSGKTTFGKRLTAELKTKGFRALHIYMDDYFCDRDTLPLDAQGKRDIEAFTALNTELLCERLDCILDGGQIPKRKFDFKTGKGSDTTDRQQISEQDFILIDGIHGLNPIISKKIGEERLSKIYVMAFTLMNIDTSHRISTSDNRLLRRMVRDHNYRGFSAEYTLAHCSSIRVGEERNIFPYQEEASFLFNSALIYEFPILARHIKPLLKDVVNEKMLARVEYLNTFLSFFEEYDDDLVPGTSILREFIGNSKYKY